MKLVTTTAMMKTEDSDDNFDDGDDWLDRHGGGEEAQQPRRDRYVEVCCSRVPQLTNIWMSLSGASGLGNLTGLLPILPVGRDHYDDCFE